MRTRLLLGAAISAALVLVVGARIARACGDDMKQEAYNVISVDELATALQSHQHMTVIDANGAETRQKFGVIPGAQLLSNFSTYDPAAELPADKTQTLVFYCGSTMCTAAPQAAMRAAAAGYTNIYVLHVGIKGWTAANKPTVRPLKNS